MMKLVPRRTRPTAKLEIPPPGTRSPRSALDAPRLFHAFTCYPDCHGRPRGAGHDGLPIKAFDCSLSDPGIRLPARNETRFRGRAPAKNVERDSIARCIAPEMAISELSSDGRATVSARNGRSRADTPPHSYSTPINRDARYFSRAQIYPAIPKSLVVTRTLRRDSNGPRNLLLSSRP